MKRQFKGGKMGELISIICTVKDGEKTIEKTIDSILNQTYSNLEIIIVDDGSKDNTKSIIKEYSENDSRIKPYYSSGMGRSQALNKAIKLASGKYIANIDADDLFHPQKTEIQMKFFEKNPDIFLISTDFEVVYGNDSLNWNLVSKENIKPVEVTKSILIKNTIIHSSVMINKEKLNEIGNYNENQLTQVDYELWLRAFNTGNKMVILDEKLVAKRIHESQSYENKKRVLYTFNSMKLQLKYILKNLRYFYYLPIPILVFIFAQLPYSTRSKINKVLKV